MMIRAAVKHLRMQIRTGMMHEAIEEIGQQLRLQIADEAHLHQVFINQRGPAAQIHGNHGQRLIHRQHEISRAVDAFAVAQSLRKQLPHDDADIFHGMVLVHIEIAIGFQLEVEAAVLREQLQHVIEEADAGRDLIASAAFDAQFGGDARLFGVAFDFSGSRQSRPPAN